MAQGGAIVVSLESPDLTAYGGSTKSVKTTGTLLFLLICLSLVAAAKDKREWKTGILVSITDSRSNRVIGSLPGTVQTVEYVEYRISVLFDGVIYVGSYRPRWSWSYAPTDFVVNALLRYQ